MTVANYSDIEHLIASQEQNGSRIVVVFRCPERGIEAEGRGTVRRSKEIRATIERSVKKNVWSSLRKAATSTISSTLGTGAVGRIAKDVARTTLAAESRKAEFSQDEIRAAVVDAFASVRSSFEQSGESGQWIGAEST